jgi:hypothetical protein
MDAATLRSRLANAASKEPAAGAADALDAVYSLLMGLGIPPPEMRPLFALMAALADHANGKPNDLLRVHKRAGQRAHVSDAMFKCCAAVTMTVLQRSGMTKADAARRVSQALAANGVTVAARTIDGWHREITAERVADDGVISSYRVMLAAANDQPDAGQAALILLHRLPTMPREKL